MVSGTEKVDEGGAARPSDNVKDGDDPITKMANQLVKIAIGSDGKMLPDAEVQMALRSMGDRAKLLEEVLLGITPDGVSASVWTSWLNGGRAPAEPKLKKVGYGDEAPSRTLERAIPRVKAQEKKIASLEANLASEKRQLTQMQAYEKSALHWYIAHDLISIMAPTFAMGPAWTLMRAISGYLSDEKAEELTFFTDHSLKNDDIRRHREMRLNDTKRMLDALDFWAGNDEFETSIRDAIEKVIVAYDDKREGQVAAGRRRRSRADMERSVHPESLTDAKKILDGLKG